jgi:anthranilate phosphoribosyltransferase
LLAPHFHPTYSLLSPLRKELAARGEMTIFNLLGPLLNPAAPDFQLTGVFRGDLLDLYATAMGLLGRRCAWAVHGPGLRPGEGIDELSVTGPSQCVEVLSKAASQGSGSHSIAFSVALRAFTLNPADLGFEAATDPLRLLGGDAAVNAERIMAILSGRERGSASDMVVLNASAALRVAGLASDLREAKSMALESIASGAASLTLKKLIEATSQVSVP